MQVEFIGYPNCSTSKKAEKYLKDHGIAYTFRHIVEDTPSVEELNHWLIQSNYPLLKLVNTSGKVYQSLHLKDRINTISEDELLHLLADHGMLLKRPIIIYQNKMLSGFRESNYDAFFEE